MTFSAERLINAALKDLVGTERVRMPPLPKLAEEESYYLWEFTPADLGNPWLMAPVITITAYGRSRPGKPAPGRLTETMCLDVDRAIRAWNTSHRNIEVDGVQVLCPKPEVIRPTRPVTNSDGIEWAAHTIQITVPYQP